MYDGVYIALENGIPPDSYELLDKIEDGLVTRIPKFLAKTQISKLMRYINHDHPVDQSSCPKCMYENSNLKRLREFYKDHPRLLGDTYFLQTEKTLEALEGLKTMRRGDELTSLDEGSNFIVQRFEPKKTEQNSVPEIIRSQGVILEYVRGERILDGKVKEKISYQGVIVERVNGKPTVKLIPEKEFEKMVKDWEYETKERSSFRSLFPW